MTEETTFRDGHKRRRVRKNPLHVTEDDRIGFWQLRCARRHNLIIEHHLAPRILEHQQRAQDVMTEVTALLAATCRRQDKPTKFVKAKRLGRFD